MILSLTTYSLLAFILWLLAKDQLNRKNRCAGDVFLTWQNIAAIGIFAFFYGVRYNVGVDNLTYINFFEQLEKGTELREDSLELGFGVVQKIFVRLGLHYSAFIGLWGGMQIGLIYYALRRNKYLLPLIALFIVLGPTWLSWANIMRQAVVECAFVVLIDFVITKKICKYFIGVVLCCLIHKSAILLIPFYFILQKPIFPKNKWIAVGCTMICTIIGMTPTWVNSLNFVENVLSILDYDSYVTNFEEIMQDQDNFRAWGPARAGIWMLYLLTTWIYLYLRERFNFNRYFDTYFECFFYGNCLFELIANTSQIFVRPISYFLSFSLLVVPICIYYLWKAHKPLTYFLMCILAFFNTYWWTIKAFLPGGNGEVAPEVYKFFFLQ